MSGFATYDVTVSKTGSVKANGVIYWSEELDFYCGSAVQLRVWPDEGSPAQVYMGGHYICSPNPIRDTGFATPSSVLKYVAEIRQAAEIERQRVHDRQALIVSRQADLLLQILDQTIEHSRAGMFTRVGQVLTHHLQHLRKLLPLFGQSLPHQPRHSDLQGAERCDLRFEIAKRIFELNYAVGVDHAELPPLKSDAKPSATGDAGHRLCGGAK